MKCQTQVDPEDFGLFLLFTRVLELRSDSMEAEFLKFLKDGHKDGRYSSHYRE